MNIIPSLDNNYLVTVPSLTFSKLIIHYARYKCMLLVYGEVFLVKRKLILKMFLSLLQSSLIPA